MSLLGPVVQMLKGISFIPVHHLPKRYFFPVIKIQKPPYSHFGRKCLGISRIIKSIFSESFEDIFEPSRTWNEDFGRDSIPIRHLPERHFCLVIEIQRPPHPHFGEKCLETSWIIKRIPLRSFYAIFQPSRTNSFDFIPVSHLTERHFCLVIKFQSPPQPHFGKKLSRNIVHHQD